MYLSNKFPRSLGSVRTPWTQVVSLPQRPGFDSNLESLGACRGSFSQPIACHFPCVYPKYPLIDFWKRSSLASLSWTLRWIVKVPGIKLKSFRGHFWLSWALLERWLCLRFAYLPLFISCRFVFTSCKELYLLQLSDSFCSCITDQDLLNKTRIKLFQLTTPSPSIHPLSIITYSFTWFEGNSAPLWPTVKQCYLHIYYSYFHSLWVNQ